MLTPARTLASPPAPGVVGRWLWELNETRQGKDLAHHGGSGRVGHPALFPEWEVMLSHSHTSVATVRSVSLVPTTTWGSGEAGIVIIPQSTKQMKKLRPTECKDLFPRLHI